MRREKGVLCPSENDTGAFQCLRQVLYAVQNNVVAVCKYRVGSFTRKFENEVHFVAVAEVVASFQRKIQYSLVGHLCNACDGGVCQVLPQKHAKGGRSFWVVGGHFRNVYSVYACVCRQNKFVSLFIENKQHNLVPFGLINFGDFSAGENVVHFFAQQGKTQSVVCHKTP